MASHLQPAPRHRALRAFRAAACLLEQLTRAPANDDRASAELSIAVTLMSGELFEQPGPPGIG